MRTESPPWYDAISDSTAECDLLVAAINAFDRRMTNLAAILFVSALEAVCKAKIEEKYPGIIIERKGIERFRVDKLPPHIAKELEKTIKTSIDDGVTTCPQDFGVYEWLLKKCCRGDDSLIALVKRSRKIREARNLFIHRGVAVCEDTLNDFLGVTKRKSFGLDTRGVETLIGALPDRLHDQFHYWPDDAGKDLKERIRALTLREVFPA